MNHHHRVVELPSHTVAYDHAFAWIPRRLILPGCSFCIKETVTNIVVFTSVTITDDNMIRRFTTMSFRVDGGNTEQRCLVPVASPEPPLDDLPPPPSSPPVEQHPRRYILFSVADLKELTKKTQTISSEDLWSYVDEYAQLTIEALFFANSAHHSIGMLHARYGHLFCGGGDEKRVLRYAAWVIIAHWVMGPMVRRHVDRSDGRIELTGAVEGHIPLIDRWIEAETTIAKVALWGVDIPSSVMPLVSELYPNILKQPSQLLGLGRPLGKRLTPQVFVEHVLPVLTTRRTMLECFYNNILSKEPLPVPANMTIEVQRLRAYYHAALCDTRRFMEDIVKKKKEGTRSLLSESVIREGMALREMRLRLGHWTAPRDGAEAMTRLASLEPDIEDLFANSAERLPRCMHQVLTHARTKGHLKNDERRAVSSWCITMAPMITATEDQAMLVYRRAIGSTAPFTKEHWADVDGQLRYDRRRYIRQSSQHAFGRWSCQQIQANGEIRDPESQLYCPYASTMECAKACGLPEADTSSLRYPTDVVLYPKKTRSEKK